jgi:hypothetical protein
VHGIRSMTSHSTAFLSSTLSTVSIGGRWLGVWPQPFAADSVPTGGVRCGDRRVTTWLSLRHEVHMFGVLLRLEMQSKRASIATSRPVRTTNIELC